MRAARQILLGRCAKAAWQNPYVTDGLVAMWDGKWNAGWGVHDPNATVWKNLLGDEGLDFPLTGMTVAEDSVYTNQVSNSTRSAVARTDYTIEAVACSLVDKPRDLVCNNFLSIGMPPYSTTGSLSDSVSRPFGFGVTSNWWSLVFFRYSSVAGKWMATASDLRTTSIINVPDFDWGRPRSFCGITRTDGFVDLRINGVTNMNSASGSWPGDSADYTQADAFPLAIGVVNQYARHRLFNLRLYSRAITAAEISANYAIDKERFNLP